MSELPGPAEEPRLPGPPIGWWNLNSVLLLIIAVVAGGTVLRLMGGIFVPLVIALLLSFVFSPLITGLVKLHIPRFLAITLVLLLFLAAGFLLGLIVYSSVESLIREFPRYQSRIAALLRDGLRDLNLPADVAEELNITGRLSSAVLRVSTDFMSFANSFTVVLIFLLFILMEKPYLRRKVNQALKDHTTRKIAIIFRHINSQIGRYIAVKLFVSSLTAVVVYIAFNLIGLDFTFIWAVLTFLFNFIPSIGSIAVTILSVAFAVLQFLPDWQSIFAVLISMGTAQFLIGNVLDPKLLGDRLNLSPVIILFSLLAWGWLWGIAGLFLAVPMTVAIKIVFENIPGLEPVGILMGTGNYRPRRRHRGDAARREENGS
ncbi:MAG: AI-2E family transporter [Alkalispirochaetaceae bacterium]